MAVADGSATHSPGRSGAEQSRVRDVLRAHSHGVLLARPAGYFQDPRPANRARLITGSGHTRHDCEPAAHRRHGLDRLRGSVADLAAAPPAIAAVMAKSNTFRRPDLSALAPD